MRRLAASWPSASSLVGQSELPLAAAGEHVKAFCRRGWVRQPKRGKGSHIILTKPGHRATLSIPDHNPVKRGTLAKLIAAAVMTIEDYLNAFND